MKYYIANLSLEGGQPELMPGKVTGLVPGIMKGLLYRDDKSVARVSESLSQPLVFDCEWTSDAEQTLFEGYVLNFTEIQIASQTTKYPLVKLYESNIPTSLTRQLVLQKLFRYAWEESVGYWFKRYTTVFRVHGDLPHHWRILDEPYSPRIRKKVDKHYKGLNPVYYNTISNKECCGLIAMRGWIN